LNLKEFKREYLSKNHKVTRKEDAQRNWWIVVADGKTVGRVATEVAVLLRGKHKPDFNTSRR